MENKNYNLGLGDDVFFMEKNIIMKGFISQVRITQYNKYNSEGRLVSDYEKKENVGYAYEYKIVCDDSWFSKHITDWMDQRLVFSSEKEILQNLLNSRKKAERGEFDDGKEIEYEVLLKEVKK